MNTLLLKSLHLEARDWNCGDNFPKLQLFEDGNHPGDIKTDHEDVQLLFLIVHHLHIFEHI